MKHAYILAAFAAALTAAPAQAQPVAADLLPAHEVATIVASMGMRLEPVRACRPRAMRNSSTMIASRALGRLRQRRVYHTIPQ